MESHVGTPGRAGERRGKPLTVLVLDIDYFKAINDGHGHDGGDDVQQYVSPISFFFFNP